MDKIAVLDFGGQYAHLITNRIRRFGVYCEILDGETEVEKLNGYKGIILSGGPASVTDENSVKCDPAVFELGVPILGICYGHHLTAHLLGGEVAKGNIREYGPANVQFLDRQGIFEGLESTETVWMSHFDQVTKPPEGFHIVAETEDCPIAAMANYERNIYTVQFHPEVTHTPCGRQILENFIELTGARHEWNMDAYIEEVVEGIKKQVGDKKCFMMVSGGVDSTVAFMLLDKAIGQENVYGLFVDTGFLRLNERSEVENSLYALGIKNLHVHDASAKFYDALQNIYDPEQKRTIIGNLFLEVQAEVVKELGLDPEHWLLGQGTIYPDTIETGGTKHADTIKTHHNRVPEVQKLIDQGLVVEPLAQLYKDEVRLVGERLGLKEKMVWRHPFPGPGLAIRSLCAQNEEYPHNVANLEEQIHQVLQRDGLRVKILPVKSVGVQGDERSYKHCAVLYGKEVYWDRLNILSTQITNQFPDVNRVVYGLFPQDFNSFEVNNAYLTKDRISILQKADKIVMDYLVEADFYNDIWQFPVVQMPISVNGRPGETIVLRPVNSTEAMTANFYHMEYTKLNELVKRLSTLNGVSAVVYDITNKPPGTIEWE